MNALEMVEDKIVRCGYVISSEASRPFHIIRAKEELAEWELIRDALVATPRLTDLGEVIQALEKGLASGSSAGKHMMLDKALEILHRLQKGVR